MKDVYKRQVYIRAGGGGDYTDPDFERNYTEAKAAGMKIGFYYYVDAATVSEADEQAAHFASLVKDKEPNCRPAMEYVCLLYTSIHTYFSSVLPPAK